MPWYAMVAIVVFGSITILSMVTGKSLPWSERADQGELETLRRRVEALEKGTARPELERRVERLETRQDRREARDSEQDRWAQQARELGLDQGDAGPGRERNGPGTDDDGRPASA